MDNATSAPVETVGSVSGPTTTKGKEQKGDQAHKKCGTRSTDAEIVNPNSGTAGSQSTVLLLTPFLLSI